MVKQAEQLVVTAEAESVQQAVTYLGTREIAGITFEMGLRAAFPPAPALSPPARNI